jgi:hypothetical protein
MPHAINVSSERACQVLQYLISKLRAFAVASSPPRQADNRTTSLPPIFAERRAPFRPRRRARLSAATERPSARARTVSRPAWFACGLRGLTCAALCRPLNMSLNGIDLSAPLREINNFLQARTRPIRPALGNSMRSADRCSGHHGRARGSCAVLHYPCFPAYIRPRRATGFCACIFCDSLDPLPSSRLALTASRGVECQGSSLSGERSLDDSIRGQLNVRRFAFVGPPPIPSVDSHCRPGHARAHHDGE